MFLIHTVNVLRQQSSDGFVNTIIFGGMILHFLHLHVPCLYFHMEIFFNFVALQMGLSFIFYFSDHILYDDL